MPRSRLPVDATSGPDQPAAVPPPSTPTSIELFIAFAKLAVTSFGGGLSAWIMDECVSKRQWLTEAEFLDGLAMAQALPGVNVVNLPIWIGYRLRGAEGALAAALGMVLPAMAAILAIASAFEAVSGIAGVRLGMQGAAAAAIGLMLSMGLRAARRQVRQLVPASVMVMVFAGVGLMKLPMPLVVAVLAPISIWLAWHRRSRHG